MLCSFSLDRKYINNNCILPYSLNVAEINSAVMKTYQVYHGLNSYLSENNHRALESMLLANTLSGMLSELMVKHLADFSKGLIKNTKVGGHPDLLPAESDSSSIHRGSEGLEIKVSQSGGGWQGHNPEAGHLMIFRYDLENGYSLRFTEILCSYLEQSDWNYSGRNENSRRTPTATINKIGVEKLRNNYIYRLPGFGVGKHKME